MKKRLKYLLVALMVFSQLSSPTLIYADVIDEIVNENNQIDENTLNNNQKNSKKNIMLLNGPEYNFDITPTVEDTKITIEIDDIATDSLVEDATKYVIASKITFNKILDEQIESTSEEEKIAQVTGAQLKDYTQEFNNIGADTNGNYQYELSIYKVETTDVLADDADETTLETFIATKSSVYEDSLTDFYKNEIPTRLEIEALGNELTCIEKICTLEEDATDKEVEINYNILIGDTTIEPSDVAYIKFTINDELTLYDYIINEYPILDFSEMLYGSYDIEVSLVDENNNDILTDKVTIEYAKDSYNTNLEDYYDIPDNILFEELVNKVISATTLDETTKEELGIDMDLLQDFLVKKPVDDDISYGLSIVLNQEITLESFTTTDEGETYFGTIMGEELIGRLNESDPLLTVEEIIEAFDNSPYIVSIEKNGETIDEGYVETGMELVIEYYGNELRYTFVVKADIDGGLVTESEVNTMIDAVLELEDLEPLYIHVSDLNEDDYLNILDISSLAASISVGSWVQAQPYGDIITPTIKLETTDTIRVGDTFKVSLNLSGFENDYINAIEGILDYDKSALTLVGITVGDPLSEYQNFNYDTAHFIQAGLDIVEEDSQIMTFTFKALKETTTTIDLAAIVGAMDGSYISLEDGNAIDVTIKEKITTTEESPTKPTTTVKNETTSNKTVHEQTIYVDSSETIITLQKLLGDKYTSSMGYKEYKLTGNTTVIYVDVKTESGEVETYKFNVVKVYPKSSNNYLQTLEIEGYEIEFDKNTFEYEITVESDVTSLDITAIAELASANVRIYGNDNFKEGENIVTIVVTAEDGSELTYTIKVNKKAETKKVENGDDADEDDTEEEKDNNTEKTIIIILIILVVIGLLYLIFKKDDEDEENKKN